MSRQRRDQRFTQAKQGSETDDQESTEAMVDSGQPTGASATRAERINTTAATSANVRPGAKRGLRPRSKDEHRRAAAAGARAGASVRPRKPRACGKVRYPDRIAAVLAMARISAVGEQRAKDIRRAYQCSRCGGWHLTSLATWNPKS